MAIAILPYGQPSRHFCDLGTLPFESAEWPLGDRPQGTVLRDLGTQDHLILYASSKAFTASHKSLRCRTSLLLLEPPIIQQRYYRLLPLFARSYHRILTHNTDVLRKLDNARFLAHGGMFLKELPPPSAAFEKAARVAMIASTKRDTPGQRLRHAIADWSKTHARDLALFGRGYQPLDDKSAGHLPYRFSVVIENSRTPGYFTEKLIDSLLCSSIPIYWGAPDIEHFFDPGGMILCRNEVEVRGALLHANEAVFERQSKALEENRTRALQYLDPHERAAKLLAAEDQVRPGSP